MFEYDDKDFSDLVDVTDITWSIMPPQDIEDEKIPQKAGKQFQSVKDDVREIDIDINILADEDNTYVEKIFKVAEYLYKNEPKKLKFKGKDWFVYAIVKGDTKLDPKVNYGEGTITFYCPDPHKYGEEVEQDLDDFTEIKYDWDHFRDEKWEDIDIELKSLSDSDFEGS